MKTKTLTISTGFHDPVLESLINKKDAEFKDLMRKNGRHFANSNRPLAMGDSIIAYVGEPKAGCEQLIAQICQHLQPDSQVPNAKIDEVRFGAKVQNINEEIGEKKASAGNMENEINNYNPGSVPIRLWIVGIANLIIMISEVVFNTASLQEWGDSMASALLLSLGISTAVFSYAHISAHIYKKQATRLRRIICAILTIVTVSLPFLTLAVLRTQHLAGQDIQSNPSDFVSVNMFLFLVSLLLALIALPEWDEVKDHLEKRRTYRAVARQNKEIKTLKKEKGQTVDILADRTQDRVTIGFYTNHLIARVKKLFHEQVETFKSTNLAYRTDGKTPDCYYKTLPELDTRDFNFSIITNNQES